MFQTGEVKSMAKDSLIIAFANEINHLKDGFTQEKAEMISKRIELQMKLEELHDKRREFKYGKFLRFSPVVVPLMAALLAFAGSMAVNAFQTWSQIQAPKWALVQKAVEAQDRKQAAERLFFLSEAGLISLKEEQRRYLQEAASK
jgi:hypothetical protein